MKLLVGIVLSLAVVQTIALPTVERVSEPESLPIVKPTNEIVETFRRELDREFVRFQNFYDRSNVAMRNYRLGHVGHITRIYNSLLTIYGDDLGAIYALFDELDDSIETRTTDVGSVNACIQRITDERNVLGGRVATSVQECALTANTTLSAMLRDIFYPTFTAIQTELSTLPLAVVDALSRGNVLNDEQEIIAYLSSRYEVIELQWLGAVSQLLRWDTSRFETEGLFMVDETAICLAEAIIDLIFNFSRLLNELSDC